MNKNQKHIILERVKSDVCFKFMEFTGVRSDVRLKVCELVYKRSFNGITQAEVATSTGVSLRKIQRFEAGQVDSLSLFMYYQNQFEHLPSKKKASIPKWVHG